MDIYVRVGSFVVALEGFPFSTMGMDLPIISWILPCCVILRTRGWRFGDRIMAVILAHAQEGLGGFSPLCTVGAAGCLIWTELGTCELRHPRGKKCLRSAAIWPEARAMSEAAGRSGSSRLDAWHSLFTPSPVAQQKQMAHARSQHSSSPLFHVGKFLAPCQDRGRVIKIQ